MGYGANPAQTATPQAGAGTAMSGAQFFNSLGIQPGADLGMATAPNMPNLGGSLPSGNMSQTGLSAAAMGGQAQQLPPGFTLPGGRVPGQAGPQMGAMQSPAAQPSWQQSSAATGGNVFNQAADAYNAALAGPNIGQFANPFQQQVINRTMGDIGSAQQMAMNQLGQQATAARAFGGSRQGVAEAQTNAGFAKQLADTSANLNMQGFNTALGAAQNQQQMLSQLAGQGFGFGQALNQQQMQQGGMQQGMMQMLIDAARGQYAGFTGAPQQALTLPLAALGASQMGQQTQTQTQKPGLFNYLSLGLGLL